MLTTYVYMYYIQLVDDEFELVNKVISSSPNTLLWYIHYGYATHLSYIVHNFKLLTNIEM